jgi:hypothetical protein
VDGDPLYLATIDHVKEECKPDNVVEMRMTEKDIDRIGLEIFRDTIGSRTRVEHDPQFREHETSGLPLIAGMIANGSKQH